MKPERAGIFLGLFAMVLFVAYVSVHFGITMVCHG